MGVLVFAVVAISVCINMASLVDPQDGFAQKLEAAEEAEAFEGAEEAEAALESEEAVILANLDDVAGAVDIRELAEESVEWASFYVESNTLIPVHPEASDASAVVGSLNPGAIVYGFLFDEAWVCIADRDDTVYYVKSAHMTPFTNEMSEIALFQDIYEVVSQGFTINTSINSISGMTLEDVTFLLQAHPNLQEIKESILLHERQYGVNAFFILGVASQESGYGSSLLARNKNNLFGIGAYDEDTYENALAFASKSEGVEYFCTMMARYRENGRMTPAAIRERYASDELWANKVVQIMNSYASQVKNR